MREIINKQIYDESIQHFIGQQTNEKIVYCFNQHWVVIIWKFLRLVVVSVFFFALIYLVFLLYATNNITIEIFRWLFLAFVFTYAYYFHSRVAYIFDAIMKIYIVSNNRIICIDKSLLFKDEKEIIDLKKIQDIASAKSGFWSNIIDYGSVEITLSSTSKVKVLNYIPSPDNVVEIIDRAKRGEIARNPKNVQG